MSSNFASLIHEQTFKDILTPRFNSAFKLPIEIDDEGKQAFPVIPNVFGIFYQTYLA